MTRKSVRQRALSGETILGAMIFEFFVPGMPQMLRNAGAEYAIYDMENGGLGLETLKMLAAASRGTGVVPMVRVPRGSWSRRAAIAAFNGLPDATTAQGRFGSFTSLE